MYDSIFGSTTETRVGRQQEVCPKILWGLMARYRFWARDKRLIDKFLEREQKLVSINNDSLEDLANARQARSVEGVTLDRLLLEKLLNAMDEETRKICTWRLEGY